MPALPPYIIDPIWEQFCALLPQREVKHPWGSHRARIDDRLVFDKLVQVLVFGCAYDERSSDESHVRRLPCVVGAMNGSALG